MQRASLLQNQAIMVTNSLSPKSHFGVALNKKPASRLTVRMSKADEPKETSSGKDSYSKIEAPVRDTIPDQGKPVEQRNLQELAPGLKGSDALKPFDSDISADDAMRFAGAIPEVANGRLAMLGVVAALGAEKVTGLNVFEQVKIAPVPIALTFFLFTLATAIPVFKGQPRRGNGIFTSDAELINGRVAMVGFLGLIISTFYKGQALFFL